MDKKQNHYYIAYEDKGPSGPCGQSISCTAHWRTLYIFTDYKKAKDFVTKVTENPFSLNRSQPKILGFWSEEIGFYDVKRID